MKPYIIITAIILLIFTIISCDLEPSGNSYKYNGSLPKTPVNLSDFNTEYDDYNTTAPIIGSHIPFCFSTNRNSLGKEFDVIYKPMNIKFSRVTGELKVTEDTSAWNGIIIKQAISKIKTSGNELGPNLIMSYDAEHLIANLLYATDISGNFQINFTTNSNDDTFSTPQEVKFLNSEANDLYPCLTTTNDKIYFCSDREDGKFNIFYTNIDKQIALNSLLANEQQATYEIKKDEILSSEFDDKCPFIYKNILVFTSNRPGGYGGYDLYYSTFENNKWTVPKNMGAEINTEYDEYRPILIEERVTYKQAMMIFSSNRPGGKGGFDLYFVGIDEK